MTAPESTLDLISAQVRSTTGPRSADLNGASIAAAIGQLVNDGTIAQGQQLPTVRALARHLRVSPSTISESWRTLRAYGVISTDRRRGTVVRSLRGTVDGRYWLVPVEPGLRAVDMSIGTPDPTLLPSVAGALSKVQIDLPVTSYLDRPVIPHLESALRDRWDFEPEVVSILDGAQDALDRFISSVVSLGDRVVVEDPTFPPILDMIELAGAELVGVRMDDQGIRPDDLERVMADDPVAIVLQPRAHNPTGRTMSAERARALASMIKPTRAIVVEDDHSGAISGAELHSLAPHLPGQVVRIESFSKAYGPDLRMAALAGPTRLLNPIVRRRHLGPSWTSRLLQRVLLTLLTDPAADAQVQVAADTYRVRRNALSAALTAEGLHHEAGDGINLWVPVPDEQKCMAALAEQGIGVAPGRPFKVNPDGTDHLRLTIASVAVNHSSLAATIASSI